MSATPLKSLGMWRAQEGAIEFGAPLVVMGLVWVQAKGLLAAPTAGRGYSALELAVVLGACAAITGWAASRQVFILRRRNPWVIIAFALLYNVVALLMVSSFVAGEFATTCTDAYKGLLLRGTDLSNPDPLRAAEAGGLACVMGGVPNNPYLPGAMLRPTWSGEIPPLMWAWLLGLASVSSLGLRDVRITRSTMAEKVFRLLRFTAGLGQESALGKPKPKDGKIVACTNPTLWGEMCGQIYSADKPWVPGEFCSRCYQPFRRADREITLKVVTLFTADVDILNGLERVDKLEWERGEPVIPDARISGAERWVHMGHVTLPDAISVAQALSIVHELLGKWAGEADPRIQEAAKLAQVKASRVSAWIWTGSLASRLTYARPNTRAMLAIGPARLRDLISEGGEELWLQLDVGVLPIELRLGSRRAFKETGREAELHNQKLDLWIPTTNAISKKEHLGLWVPRIEGEALRKWLSTDRLRDEAWEGGSIPVPYLVYKPEIAPDSGIEHIPDAGSLDLVRRPLDKDGMEPLVEPSIGESIAEWDWLEWEQVQLLRQQALVLVASKGERS